MYLFMYMFMYVSMCVYPYIYMFLSIENLNTIKYINIYIFLFICIHVYVQLYTSTMFCKIYKLKKHSFKYLYDAMQIYILKQNKKYIIAQRHITYSSLRFVSLSNIPGSSTCIWLLSRYLYFKYITYWFYNINT